MTMLPKDLQRKEQEMKKRKNLHLPLEKKNGGGMSHETISLNFLHHSVHSSLGPHPFLQSCILSLRKDTLLLVPKDL